MYLNTMDFLNTLSRILAMFSVAATSYTASTSYVLMYCKYVLHMSNCVDTLVCFQKQKSVLIVDSLIEFCLINEKLVKLGETVYQHFYSPG